MLIGILDSVELQFDGGEDRQAIGVATFTITIGQFKCGDVLLFALLYLFFGH